MIDWSKDYKSEIISFRFGNRLMIGLNSYDVIKEALVNKGYAFSGRRRAVLMHTVGWDSTKGKKN